MFDRHDNFSAPYEHQTLKFTESMYDWPRRYKTVFMLNPTEHEIPTAHKTKIRKIQTFLAFSLSNVGYIMLKNVKMLTLVSILTFMSRIKFVV